MRNPKAGPSACFPPFDMCQSILFLFILCIYLVCVCVSDARMGQSILNSQKEKGLSKAEAGNSNLLLPW